MVKNLPANAGDMGLIPGLVKIPWRREWLPTINIAWEIPRIKEPCGLQWMGLQ